MVWVLVALALAPVTAGAAWRAGNLFGGGYIDVGLYGTIFPTGTVPSRVYANKLSSTGTAVAYAWKDISDDLWLNALTEVREMAVGADGTVYMATSNGVFINDSGETLP